MENNLSIDQQMKKALNAVGSAARNLKIGADSISGSTEQLSSQIVLAGRLEMQDLVILEAEASYLIEMATRVLEAAKAAKGIAL